MSTTKRDLQALHYLAQRLRDETHGAGKWHDNGLTAVLSRLEGHNLAVTIERVTRHAADPEARTPAAIERPFVPDAPKAGIRFPARAGVDECRTHRGEWADSCRACAADRLAAPDEPHDGPPMPREAVDLTSRIAVLRHNVVPLRPLSNRPDPTDPQGDAS